MEHDLRHAISRGKMSLVYQPQKRLHTDKTTGFEALLNRGEGDCTSRPLDDFDTGYSSLSNLRAFPFDKIKIDRPFISSVDTSPQAATTVKAVLGIGRDPGLRVLAEGGG